MRYQGLSSRITYGFRDTYMIDFNFGYTGSENFQPGRRFGFFPSVALGWVPTQYEFMRRGLPFLNFLKIRASYGTVGNDRLAGNQRFPYLTLVNRGSVSPFGSTAVESLIESYIGADNLLWGEGYQGRPRYRGPSVRRQGQLRWSTSSTTSVTVSSSSVCRCPSTWVLSLSPTVTWVP